MKDLLTDACARAVRYASSIGSRPITPHPEDIARLASLLGADRVGSPRTVEGHRPERYALASYAPPAPPHLAREPKKGRGLLAVRALRPPVPLEVITSLPGENRGEGRLPPLPAGEGRGEGHLPIRLVSVKSPPGATVEIQGTVRVAAGPWSLEEGWWSDDPVERDYWDIELSDGGLYRIFRNRRGEAWSADGLYD